jgi:hypothetical protein
MPDTILDPEGDDDHGGGVQGVQRGHGRQPAKPHHEDRLQEHEAEEQEGVQRLRVAMPGNQGDDRGRETEQQQEEAGGPMRHQAHRTEHRAAGEVELHRKTAEHGEVDGAMDRGERVASAAAIPAGARWLRDAIDGVAGDDHDESALEGVEGPERCPVPCTGRSSQPTGSLIGTRRQLRLLQQTRHRERLFEAYPLLRSMPGSIRDCLDFADLRVPSEKARRYIAGLQPVLNVALILYAQRSVASRGLHLCRVVESAELSELALDLVQSMERRLKRYVVVAYRFPLRLQSPR